MGVGVRAGRAAAPSALAPPAPAASRVATVSADRELVFATPGGLKSCGAGAC